MATRPVFQSLNKTPFYREKNLDFVWHSGFAKVQKQKSIQSLHDSAAIQGLGKALEISTKSTSDLGIKLSAFNLRYFREDNTSVTVEVAFQSAKVFQNGGPFLDLLTKQSWEAKKDPRLRSSGSLLRFQLDGHDWPLIPKTFFYDWLYTNALKILFEKNPTQFNEFLSYECFTDIEFNPQKSLNCQARSAAIFKSLHTLDLLHLLIKPNWFKNIYSHQSTMEYLLSLKPSCDGNTVSENDNFSQCSHQNNEVSENPNDET